MSQEHHDVLSSWQMDGLHKNLFGANHKEIIKALQ